MRVAAPAPFPSPSKPGPLPPARPCGASVDLIDRLPPKDQQVLWLFCCADYSTADIAGAVGLSEPQPRPRLYRARKHFRKIGRDADE